MEASRLVRKNKEISMQSERLKFTVSQLESVKELSDTVTNGSDQEALFAKKQVTNDVKRITECYKKLDSCPVELATIEFEEYKGFFPQFGQLYENRIVPSNCQIMGPTSLPVNDKIDFKIITKNCINAYCSKGDNEIIAQVQSSKGDFVHVEVKDNKDGSHSASYVTEQVGELKLLVTIEGQHIKGSPYVVAVCQDYKSVEKSIKVVNNGRKMGKAFAVACNRDGLLTATCDSQRCVYIFNILYSLGKLVRKFGSKGSGKGQFQFPYGLAFDTYNYLYVDVIHHTNYTHEVELKFVTDHTRWSVHLCQLSILTNERYS